MAASRIKCSIDLEVLGKRQGFLTVPWSRDDSAWGSIQIPITVARGGRGPTILFTGGNHGDEYEGPIAIMKVARAIDAGAMNGGAIFLPTMNHPAVKTATRTSPIDIRNMNRVFPGDRLGTQTLMIADYVVQELVARADIVVDLHSGGKTLDFVPSCVLHELDDADMMARTQEAALAFGAPWALILEELDMEGMLDLVVESTGKMFLSTELGGGGSTTPERVRIAERGLWNLLRHFGVVEGRVEYGTVPSRLMRTPEGGFVICRTPGMFEPLVELGQSVEQGQPMAVVYDFEDHRNEPVTYEAPCSGLLYARHFPGLVKHGDCMAVLARGVKP